MKVFRKFEPALRSTLRDWTKAIGEVDILVGIPCFNVEAQAAVFKREKPYLHDKLLAWTE
ncbi:MAG: hypothetical protein ACE5JQ_14415 [Candidatus Methylomirabilales bacterium]